MVLVLLIGDTHVPHRASDLPDKFKSLLVPGKIHKIICPGNLCSEAMYDYLRSICADVTVTAGDFDDNAIWPDSQVLSVGGLRVGVCHGHQVVPWGDRDALGALCRRLRADVLVTGHSHRFQAYQHEGRLIIDPGTATGAYSAHSAAADPTPSFVLMDADSGKATVYVYELQANGELKVDKLHYSKIPTPESGV